MAVRGTGLPLPESDAILQPTAGVQPITTAAEWGRIAESSGRLASIGLAVAERETNKAQLGYLADNEVEITRKRIELRNQYANDPQGFDREWTAYRDGKLGAAEPWAVPHLRKSLASEGNAGYSATLEERRRRDEQLDQRRLKALADQTADEVIVSAMAGTLGNAEGIERTVKFKHVLDSAVNAGFLTRDEADLRILETTSRAGAEAVIRNIGETYRANRAKGLEAGEIALRDAEERLLRSENEDLRGLSPEQRRAYYEKAAVSVRAFEAERKQDLILARQAKTEIEQILRSGERVPQEVVDSVVTQLSAAGGHAEAAKLRASAARFDNLQAFARRPLGQQVETYQSARTYTGARFNPEIDQLIQEAAAATNLDPGFLRRYVQIESSGNPNQVTGRYKGLLQLSDEQFRAFGGQSNIFDPRENLQAGARKLASQTSAFRQKYGRDPQAYELYLIHQQGEGGFAAHMSNPSAPAWQNMASTAEGRQRGDAWAKAAIWGNVPDNVKAMFPGGVESVTSADFVAIWRQRVGDGGAGQGVDFQLLSGQRKIIAKEADDAWKKIRTELDAGRRPDPVELQTVIQGATVANDANLLEEIAGRLQRFDSTQAAARGPLAAQQGAITELRGQPSLTSWQSAWLTDLEAVAKQTKDGLERDAVSLGIARFPERFQPLQAFNLTDRGQAFEGLKERAGIAGFVAQNYEKPDVPMLTTADVTQLTGAMASPDARQAAGALEVLAQIPDQFFVPTLKNEQITEALRGAARSTDPAKYMAAMSALDRMWARAPQEMHRIMGDDVFNTLQNWQAKLRYWTTADVAEELKRRDDPQVVERRQKLEKHGRDLVSKRSVDELLNDLDPGLFVRAPRAPLDSRTRDAAMADYETLFATRYAETLDKSVAHRQAIEKMKLHWSASQLNGGRLTLYAPETRYPRVNGSHEWMREQLVRDVTSAVGTIPDELNVMSDRVTEQDIGSGRPPSYLVTWKNANGQTDMLRNEDGSPRRYYWVPAIAQETASQAFQRQRERWQIGQERAASADAALLNSPIFESSTFGIKSPSLAELGFGPDSVMRPARDAADAKNPLKRAGRELSRRLNEGGDLVKRGQ